MRRILAVVSDLHCGSTVALCPDEAVELDDGGSYTPSLAQRWLYARWLEFWDRVKKARKRADWLGILSNGDLVDGPDHHQTPQVISRDPSVQMWVARRVFEPALALNPDEAFVVRGTESHVGKGASSEEAFARWLKSEGVKIQKDATTGMYSHWHLRLQLGEWGIDAAHHGRVGTRSWTKYTPVSTLAAQIVLEHANRREPPPDLALRSHLHTFADTHDQYVTRLVQTPAWQIHTAYAHQVVPEVLSDIGGLIVALEDGKPLEVEPVIFKPVRSPRMVVA